MNLKSVLLNARCRPLLGFVNEPKQWEDWLRGVESAQLFDLGIDEDCRRLPTIKGAEATKERADELRSALRRQLGALARACADPTKLHRLAETDKAWPWRKARICATGEHYLGDAADALSFLAECLEYEIRRRTLCSSKHARTAKRGPRALHVAQCACGCERFFLWEGNWISRARRFLDAKHRMDFHNRKNVARKRCLAQRRRAEGRYQ